MNEIYTELLFLMVLLVANGIFAMSEIAIVSARKVRLQQRADEGDKGAEAALKLADNPNDFLSTVQIGITLIGILAGAVGGATLTEKLDDLFVSIPLLAPYAANISFLLVVLLITYLSLVIGELVPKRIGLNNAETVASWISRPMAVLARLTSPFVRLLSWSGDTLLRLFGLNNIQENTVTEEEIKFMLEQGTQEGVFELSEQKMIERVFRLDDRPVTALMTPRTEVMWFDINDTQQQIMETLAEGQHSCYPVVQDNLDHVEGVVYARDLLTQALSGQPLDLQAITRPPVFVPESMSALEVLEKFKSQRVHLALVIDEYGGFHGLVSSNDILEAIVGTLPAEENSFLGDEEAEVVQRADGSWLIDGMLLTDEFKELFALDELPDEDDYQTLGGFVMTYLGRLPTTGDRFEWDALQFEVMDMDGRRVDKVMVVETKK